ncbi:hypothetical protein JCM12856_10890 [Spirochaeta dissipatitropha]
MITNGEFDSAIAELRALYDSGQETVPLFEISWRLAQAHIFSAEDVLTRTKNREEASRRFDEGEFWIRRTIELNPDDHIGYFWTAALIGQRGMMDGALSSLRGAGDMRTNLQTAAALNPHAAHVYYTASILYLALPRLISFGDRDAAVNFARAGVDLQLRVYELGGIVQIKEDFYLQLARSLWDRNWNHRRRDRERTAKINSIESHEHPFDRAMRYEARIELRPLSDREEALEILRQVETRLAGRELNYSDQRDWDELQSLKAEWQ